MDSIKILKPNDTDFMNLLKKQKTLSSMRTKGQAFSRYHLNSPGVIYPAHSPSWQAGFNSNRSGFRCNGLTRAGLLTLRLSSAIHSGRPSMAGIGESFQPVALFLCTYAIRQTSFAESCSPNTQTVYSSQRENQYLNC